jgi:hypothetical protein
MAFNGLNKKKQKIKRKPPPRQRGFLGKEDCLFIRNMANQSKLLYFSCRYYQNKNDFDLYPQENGNFHFWIELNGVIIDKTILKPHPQSKEKVYISFNDDERMKKTMKDLIKWWSKENDVPESVFDDYINERYKADDIYQNGQCFINAYCLYKNTPGSVLKMGLFGYKMPCRTIDIDYGF